MQRIGRKNEPHFRIVVTDVRSGPKSGKFIEVIGSYNAKMGDVQINGERAQHWISMGAQTSTSVHNFLVDKGVLKSKKKNALPKKTPIVKEAPPTAPEKTPAPEVAKEAPSEPVTETKEESAPAPAEEAVVEEAKESAPATEEAPTTEEKTEEPEASTDEAAA